MFNLLKKTFIEDEKEPQAPPKPVAKREPLVRERLRRELPLKIVV